MTLNTDGVSSKSLNSWVVTVLWETQKAKRLPQPGCYKWFPIFSVLFLPQWWMSVAHHISLLLGPIHQGSRSSPPKNGGLPVLTWAGKGEDRMFLFTIPSHDDPEQQCDCCADKRKQSAAHPHTAGFRCTKEDYLPWYKKQCILFLKLKINPANIYSKHLGWLIQSDIMMIIIYSSLFSFRDEITAVTFNLSYVLQWFDQSKQTRVTKCRLIIYFII